MVVVTWGGGGGARGGRGRGQGLHGGVSRAAVHLGAVGRVVLVGEG